MSKARSKKAWSAKEDKLICELCKNDISIAMAKMKNRSRDELVLRARVLGLFNEMDLSTWTLTKSHPSVWRPVEVAFLLENKNKPFAKIIQRLPKRSPASCILRLEKLGVAEINPNWTEAAMKVKTAKDKWTDEDIAYLKENFFEDETACAKQLGKSKARCEAKMKELGISKVKNVRYPRWSEEELDYLKAHYLQDGLDVICENLPHRTRRPTNSSRPIRRGGGAGRRMPFYLASMMRTGKRFSDSCRIALRMHASPVRSRRVIFLVRSGRQA